MGSASFLLSPLKTMATFKFLFNGIKVNDGILQRAAYSLQPDGTIVLTGRDPEGFCQEVWETFNVTNGSDPRVDYIESDTMTIGPSHPLFHLVKEGFSRNAEHNQKCTKKRLMRDRALHLAGL